MGVHLMEKVRLAVNVPHEDIVVIAIVTILTIQIITVIVTAAEGTSNY